MKYQSGILGNAEVFFGGKISVGLISAKDKTFHGISLAENYKAGEVGGTIPDSVYIHEPQVILAFDNIKSIEIMERALMQVREMLKRTVEEQAESKTEERK